MALVTLKEILEDAEKGGYAVGAFNVVNMETAQAVFSAAEEERAPLIVQITETTIGQPGKVTYTPLDDLMGIVNVLARKATVPVVIHEDHGRSFLSCKRCVEAGFTSVMRDGSLKADGKTKTSIEENIEETKKVVEYARQQSRYISVEGEMGTLGEVTDTMTQEERKSLLTQPDDAKRFVEETGVDALAIAFGTKHGPYRGRPIIELDVIREVKDVVGIPLVMHGGTGVPPDIVKQAVKLGIRKINIDTQIRMAFERAIREIMSEKWNKYIAEMEETLELGEEAMPPKYDLRKLLGPARDIAKETIKAKMRLFGCSGKV